MKFQNGVTFGANDVAGTYAALWDSSNLNSKGNSRIPGLISGKCICPEGSAWQPFSRCISKTDGFCHKNPSQVVFKGFGLPLPMY